MVLTTDLLRVVSGGVRSWSRAVGDAGGDVVADQPHPLDAVDAALGRFVGVPVLEPGARHRVDVGFAAEGDDEVDIADELRVDQFRGLAGDVDADLEQATPRTARSPPLPGLVPAECTSHGVTGDLAHQSGRHLGLAAVLHADEQHGRFVRHCFSSVAAGARWAKRPRSASET